MRARKWSLQRGSCVAVLILVIHGMLLSWIDLQYSPVVDEVGHLVAGVYSWDMQGTPSMCSTLT